MQHVQGESDRVRQEKRTRQYAYMGGREENVGREGERDGRKRDCSISCLLLESEYTKLSLTLRELDLF